MRNERKPVLFPTLLLFFGFGTDEGIFSPDVPVTREQLAAILYRFAKSLGLGFDGLWESRLDYTDADEISEYAREAMCWMTMNGILSGMGDGLLSPQGAASRAQIAAMLRAFCTAIV